MLSDDSIPVLWLLCPQVTAERLAPEGNREAEKAELNRIFGVRVLLLPRAGPCTPGPVHGMLRSANLQTSASLSAKQRPGRCRSLRLVTGFPSGRSRGPGPGTASQAAGSGQAFPAGSAAGGTLSRQSCPLTASQEVFCNQLPRWLSR